MNKELSEIMSTDGRMVEWAQAVTYIKDDKNLSSEDKEISAVMDNWAKEVGRSGFDRDHEISQLIRRAITPETVEAPSALLDAMFDQDSIGEFDDVYAEVAPKNTIQVYDAVVGGNVYRSFVDFTNIKPSGLIFRPRPISACGICVGAATRPSPTWSTISMRLWS